MRYLPLLLIFGLTCGALPVAGDVPLNDFSRPSDWRPNDDGGHAPQIAPDPERREHGPAVRLRYRDQAPHWGNLTGPATVPPQARALKLWVYKIAAQSAAAMHVWLFEPDGDAWVQPLRFAGGKLGEAEAGWHAVRLPVSGFTFQGRGPKTRDMLQVNRMLIGCNFADLEVSLAAMEWETGPAREPLPLPVTGNLTIADGPAGRMGILDMATDGHSRDADRPEPLATAHPPAQVAAAARRAGFGVTLLKPGDLLAPDVLTPQQLDVVVLPYGPYFPLAARDAFTRYLKAGGSFLATDGYAFDRLVTLTQDGWSAASPERTAADMATEGAAPPAVMNTRTGKPGDAMSFALDQIPVFDPQFPLSPAAELRPAEWLGAAAGLPRYRLDQPAAGFSACALLGANSPVFPPVYRRWIPLLQAFAADGRTHAGTALSLIHGYAGAFPHSSWAISGLTSGTNLFIGDAARERLLTRVLEDLAQKVFLHDLQTDLACYEPGETVHVSVQIANHGRWAAARTLTLSVGGKELLRRSLELAPGSTDTVTLDLPAGTISGDLVRLTARLHDGPRLADLLETAYCQRSPAVLQSGPKLAWQDNVLTVDGRATFLIGSNQTGMMYYSPHEGPLVWDRDFANMAAHNFHLLRILHFSPFCKGGAEGKPTNNPLDLRERPEKLVRQMDAIVQLAQKHRVAIFLSLHDWMPVALTDEQLAAQADWNRFWAARYRDVPGIIYDIQNEPSVDMPDRPDIVALWNEFLQSEYGSDEALRAAWSLHPPEAALPKVPLAPAGDDWSDARAADHKRFALTVLERWIRANAEGIRAGDAEAPLTVGYLPSMPPADKLLGAADLDFSNMHYYGSVAGFPTEFLFSDRRVRGQGLTVGECGAQEAHDARTQGRTDVPVEASVERFQALIHYAAGLGAGFLCNWCWKDFDESVFPWGLIQRQSDIAKPWVHTWEQESLLLGLAQLRGAVPPLLVLTPDRHRQGPHFGELHAALKRCFDLLLDQNVPFAVCTERDLDRLPPQTEALLWPLPYCPDDATFERVLAWVKSGGLLYLSGDLQHDASRHPTRAQRRDLLGLPPAAARPPFDVPESDFGQDIISTEVGRGKVVYVPYSLELRGRPENAEVYRGFLRRAGMTPPRIEPAGAPVRVLSVPTHDGHELATLARTSEEGELLSAGLPALGVGVQLAPHGCAFVRSGDRGAIVAAESQGEIQLGGKAVAAASGHFGLASLDEGDLRTSQQLIVFPHQCTEVSLAGLGQLRGAVCAIAPPSQLASRKPQPWAGPPLRFAVPGQVAVLASPAQMPQALRRVQALLEVRAAQP
ncbi:MAG: hypothetical protein KKI08_08825 [Armatimonadetes bacterium]|nr:hypothetical protein [Armatimonadota bacterium]